MFVCFLPKIPYSFLEVTLLFMDFSSSFLGSFFFFVLFFVAFFFSFEQKKYLCSFSIVSVLVFIRFRKKQKKKKKKKKERKKERKKESAPNPKSHASVISYALSNELDKNKELLLMLEPVLSLPPLLSFLLRR